MLLLLAKRIEEQIWQRLHEAGVTIRAQTLSLLQAVELGVQKGVFPAAVSAPVAEFWRLRNTATHTALSALDTLSGVSIGTELLRVLSTEKQAA